MSDRCPTLASSFGTALTMSRIYDGIGVGRFRILGGKVQNIGEGAKGGQIPSRHMASY